MPGLNLPPGYEGLTPEQQQNIATRLRLNQAAQKAPTAGGFELPAAVAAGAYFGSPEVASTVAPTIAGAAREGMTNAATQLSGEGAGTFGAEAGVGPLATAASALAILHGGYGMYRDWGKGDPVSGAAKGAQIGAGLGTIIPGAGTLAGAGIGAVAGGLLGSIKTGKHKDQIGRDSYRSALKEAGIYDDEYNLTLSDGTKVNMGVDGSIQNYNVNFDEEGIGEIVAIANPFAYLVTGGDQKKASDLAGELTNAIKGTKDPAAEMRNIFARAGITRDQAIAGIDSLSVDDQTKTVFKDTINRIGVANEATGGGAGGGITINMPKVSYPSAKPTDPRPAQAMGMLNKMLVDSTQPITYPGQKSEYQGKAVSNLNSTLNRIIGG